MRDDLRKLAWLDPVIDREIEKETKKQSNGVSENLLVKMRRRDLQRPRPAGISFFISASLVLFLPKKERTLAKS
jgi:hypothetical protein